jgi:predicted transcriptional regulator
MSGKYERDYTARHEKIVNKLIQLAEECGQGCFPVSKLANELGMDQRTVKSHLRIIEMDNAGVFVDPDEKQFCTREGVLLLAKRLGIGDRFDKPSG